MREEDSHAQSVFHELEAGKFAAIVGGQRLAILPGNLVQGFNALTRKGFGGTIEKLGCDQIAALPFDMGGKSSAAS